MATKGIFTEFLWTRERSSSDVVPFSKHHVRRHRMSVGPITGHVNFDCLVKVVSDRICHCQGGPEMPEGWTPCQQSQYQAKVLFAEGWIPSTWDAKPRRKRPRWESCLRRSSRGKALWGTLRMRRTSHSHNAVIIQHGDKIRSAVSVGPESSGSGSLTGCSHGVRQGCDWLGHFISWSPCSFSWKLFFCFILKSTQSPNMSLLALLLNGQFG
nr:uncharacterized protein LOC123479196 [Desmodus rotundus]